MIKFLIQLAITAGLGYLAGTYAYGHGMYQGPPSDIIAAFVIPFLVYRGVARMAGPIAGRLAVLSLLVAFARLTGIAFQGNSVLDLSQFELVPVGILALLAIVLPGGANGKLRVGASKAAIASGEEWAYEGKRFALHIDFKAATVRLIARKPLRLWRQAGNGKGAWSTPGRFDATWPLHQFKLGEVSPRTRAGYIPNTASAWSNGELISVTLPGGTVTSDPTGFSDIHFQHLGADEAPCDYAGLKMATGGPDSVRLVIEKVADREIARFKDSWQGVAERVGAAHAAYGNGIRERGKALRQQERDRAAAAAAQAEAAEKERIAALRTQAQASMQALLDQAGMRGEFRAGAHSGGRIDWMIAADRDGRGLVVAGNEHWQGSLAGARANIVAGKERCLEIELQDGDYERQHLKKHRMRIMQGASADTIQEWCDRVGILGAQTAAG